MGAPATSTSKAGNFHRHDVVVHVEALADGEVAGAGLVHAHSLIEGDGAVVAVHVQLHGAGCGMHGADVINGGIEQLPPVVEAMAMGQDIDFLKVEQVGLLLLYADVAHRRFSFKTNEIDVPVGHLPVKVGKRIHPFHHVVVLFGSEDVLVGFGKHLPGQVVNELAIVGISFSDVKHVKVEKM